ncbi:MAG TPA: hypothetical protein VNK23_04715 [Candidatus Dormibacteraeota bacterium]|nr:hypothetical protein [Candidatus Dormibacteraeota bacterium]
MEPKNLYFGGGAAASVFSPIALAVVLLAGLLVIFLPRNKIVVPVLLVGMLLPINQILLVGGLHFPMFRVLATFGIVRMGWAKIFGTDKICSGGMNGIDWALIILTVFTAIDGALLWESQAEVVYQLGNAYTAFGLYFLLRYSIRDEEDVRRALRAMVWVVAIVAPAMIYEHFSGNNLFYRFLGGLHAAKLEHTAARDGFFRAQGPFGHPIIAGTFGGFMVPLFVALWKGEKRDRKYALLGMLSAAAIPFAVASSTALFALLGGIGALCLWPMRRKMRLLRWGIVGTLAAGQLYMTSPVWHLIDDVSLSADSSSYHRYELVNECILHFWDWALIGTKNFASWGWDMWDLANQYVATADTAGLIPLIAFIAILVFGFRYIGKARRHYEGNKQEEFFVWAIGGSLFANVVGFFGIGYWDQVIVAWYMVLAIIAAITLSARAAIAVPAAAPALGHQPRASVAPSPALRMGLEREKHARPQAHGTGRFGRFDARER